MAEQAHPARYAPEQGTVGVIGLGNMGAGIARNLAGAGFETLVWDITPGRRAALEETATIAEPAVMTPACDIILLVVPGSDEIEDLLSGTAGMLARATRGLVLCDLTTSDPERTRALASRGQGQGVAYLDGGMSGGAVAADTGRLTLMMGGDAAVLAKARPVLDTIAARIFHLGPNGAGHAMKLIFNMVVHSNFMAVCEAGHLAARAGIPLDAMIDVFNAGNARSFISERRFPDHILSETWDGRSRVFNLHKDVTMAVEYARRVGLPANIGAETRAYLEQAVDAGMGEADFTLLYREFLKVSGPR